MENNEKEKYYCRKCMKTLSADNFYNAYDGKIIDGNGKFSVCKKCIVDLYDYFYQQYESMEKVIHRMCQALNITFSNQALDATKLHIQTLLDSGKNVNAIFSIYIMKLVATKKSMTKDGVNDFQYEDVGTIFTEKQVDIKKIPIPQDVIEFWGDDIPEEDILFLEKEFAEFKQTHSTDTRAEVVLLKQVCFNLLDIKKERLAGNNTIKLVKELQELMTKLAISPNVAKANALNAGGDSFGQWIADIERSEPAQWLLSDPRGQIYRDVADTNAYFEKYIVRPLKGFITGSRDFNTDENEEMEREFDDGEVNNFVNLDEEIN
jgi:hypothetical protein